MKDSENLVIVQIKTSDSEYSRVINRFNMETYEKEIVKVKVVDPYLVLFVPEAHKTFTHDRHVACLLTSAPPCPKSKELHFSQTLITF